MAEYKELKRVRAVKPDGFVVDPVTQELKDMKDILAIVMTMVIQEPLVLRRAMEELQRNQIMFHIRNVNASMGALGAKVRPEDLMYQRPKQ